MVTYMSKRGACVAATCRASWESIFISYAFFAAGAVHHAPRTLTRSLEMDARVRR
jgi:hypothetical protein